MEVSDTGMTKRPRLGAKYPYIHPRLNYHLTFDFSPALRQVIIDITGYDMIFYDRPTRYPNVPGLYILRPLSYLS